MMRSGISEFYNRGDLVGLCRDGLMSGRPMGWIGMIIGWLVFLGLTALLVILIVKAVQKGKHYHSAGHGNFPSANPENQQVNASATSALAILNERYAKGEVSQEEYLAKKADLLK